jgi:hypothetical protein
MSFIERFPECIISIIDDYADNIITKYLIISEELKTIKYVNDCNIYNICDICFKYDKFQLLARVIEDNHDIFDLEYHINNKSDPDILVKKLYYISRDKSLSMSFHSFNYLSPSSYNWMVRYSDKIKKTLDRTRLNKKNNILAFSLCVITEDEKPVLYTLILVYLDKLYFYLNKNISVDCDGILTFDKLITYDDIYETIYPDMYEEDKKDFSDIIENVNDKCKYLKDKNDFTEVLRYNLFNNKSESLFLKYGWFLNLYKFYGITTFLIE